jgi:hypothetical protein
LYEKPDLSDADKSAWHSPKSTNIAPPTTG